MHTNHDLPKPEGLFERIIQFSIQNAIWVMLFVCTWIAVGVYSYQKLPIDAVPDITNTQVHRAISRTIHFFGIRFSFNDPLINFT